MGVSEAAAQEWDDVCALDDLEPDRGVAALVRGHAVAIFRTSAGAVYALANHDPDSRTSVLARGLVGVRDDVPFVASSTLRHAYDLRSGRCLDDPTRGVRVFEVAVVGDRVLLGPPRG